MFTVWIGVDTGAYFLVEMFTLNIKFIIVAKIKDNFKDEENTDSKKEIKYRVFIFQYFL